MVVGMTRRRVSHAQQSRAAAPAVTSLAPAPADPLTGAAFAAGINVLNAAVDRQSQTLQDFHDATNARELAKANPSVENRYGIAVAERLVAVCRVASQDDLPMIHRELARNQSRISQDKTTLFSAINARASNNNCVANQHSQPVVTTHLVELFRTHAIEDVGIDFGKGLTPFAMVCRGHPNAKTEEDKANLQQTVESGSHIGLQDAQAFKLNKVLP